MVLLNILSSYPWHAKVVLTIAAFAINVGEFWLVAQLRAASTLARSVALQLKQSPDPAENASNLRHQFDAIKKLLKATLDLTKCTVEFKDLPPPIHFRGRTSRLLCQLPVLIFLLLPIGPSETSWLVLHRFQVL